MRIKLSHKIGISLISLSVVFSAISSASAANRGGCVIRGNTTGEGRTIRSPLKHDHRRTVGPRVRDHRKSTKTRVVRTSRPGRGSSGTPRRGTTTGAKARNHRGRIVSGFSKEAGADALRSAAKGMKDVVKFNARTAKSVHKKAKGHIPEVMRPHLPHGTKHAAKTARRAANIAHKQAKGMKNVVKVSTRSAKSVHKKAKGYVPEVMRPHLPHGTKRATKAAKGAAKSVGKKAKKLLKW